MIRMKIAPTLSRSFPCRALIGAFGVALLALTACAGPGPLVPGSEPTALIIEQNFAEDPSTAQLFYVAAIDSVPVDSSLQATRKATAGSSLLSLVSVERRIPVRSMRLTLIATHIRATPGQEAASRAAGTFLRVEGDVTLHPVADGTYFVAGELKRAGSSVWIADLKTGRRVSEVVTELH